MTDFTGVGAGVGAGAAAAAGAGGGLAAEDWAEGGVPALLVFLSRISFILFGVRVDRREGYEVGVFESQAATASRIMTVR